MLWTRMMIERGPCAFKQKKERKKERSFLEHVLRALLSFYCNAFQRCLLRQQIIGAQKFIHTYILISLSGFI